MIFIKGLGLQLANAGGLQAQVRNRDHKNKFFYLSPSPPVPLTALGLKPVMVILHPSRPILRHVALHEQAVAITYAVRKWFTITSVRCPPLKSLACVLQQAIDELSGEE